MKNNINEIRFIGQDYSPICNAAEKAELNINDDKLKDKLFLPDREIEKKYINMLYILKQFLIEISSCNLNIMDINGKSKTSWRSHKLYSDDFDKPIFDGVVGVVRKTISINLADVLYDNISDELDQNQERIPIDITLQIQTRMDTVKGSGNVKPFFLATMLLANKIEFNNYNVPENEEQIYDFLLLFWFRNQFKEACRKGFYRTYKRFDRNDDRLKGSIHIPNHIRWNMGQNNGRIAYTFRENTVDNEINHLIVCSSDCLKKKYPELVANNFDNEFALKQDIENLRQEIGYTKYKSYELIGKCLTPIAHPYFTEYEDLRQICIRILRNEGLSLFDGSSEKETKGILFYLPDFWERYLENNVLSKLRDEFEVKIQKKILVFGTKNARTALDFPNTKYSFKQETYPDFILYENNNPFMILDAKFKPNWEKTAFTETYISSVLNGLNDYNKCLRDMVSIHAHATGVIFPMAESDKYKDCKPIYQHPISEYNRIDCFYTFPIKIPKVPAMTDDTTYSDWKNRLDENVNELAEELKKKVKNEKELYICENNIEKYKAVEFNGEDVKNAFDAYQKEFSKIRAWVDN